MKISIPDTFTELGKVENLYLTAYPVDERKPFNFFVENIDSEQIKVLKFNDDKTDEFIGMAILSIYDDLTLLNYLAVVPSKRNQGLGTKMISIVKERFKDKDIILEVDNTRTEADNIEDRLRKKKFYLEAGMVEMPFMVKINGVLLEVLGTSTDISPQKYLDLYTEVFGTEHEQTVEIIKY